MAQCGWTSRKGIACAIPADVEGGSCHMHDPEGEYALQHPAYRMGLFLGWGIASEQEAALAAYQKVQCVALTTKGTRCGQMVRAGYGTDRCASHGGGRGGKRLFVSAQ